MLILSMNKVVIRKLHPSIMKKKIQVRKYESLATYQCQAINLLYFKLI